MTKDDEMTRTTVRMPTKQYAKLKKLARSTDLSIGFHIREAITAYTDKNKQPKLD